MFEGLAIVSVLFLIWMTWGRYYINNQIKNALDDVKVGNPIRCQVKYIEFLRYFQLRHTQNNEVIVIEYKDKHINIAKDEDETVLFIDESFRENTDV